MKCRHVKKMYTWFTSVVSYLHNWFVSLYFKGVVWHFTNLCTGQDCCKSKKRNTVLYSHRRRLRAPQQWCLRYRSHEPAANHWPEPMSAWIYGMWPLMPVIGCKVMWALIWKSLGGDSRALVAAVDLSKCLFLFYSSSGLKGGLLNCWITLLITEKLYKCNVGNIFCMFFADMSFDLTILL